MRQFYAVDCSLIHVEKPCWGPNDIVYKKETLMNAMESLLSQINNKEAWIFDILF